MTRNTLLAAVVALITMATNAVAEPKTMSAAEIKKTISGKTLYLSTPFGLELPIYFGRNGTMRAKGGRLARFLSKDAKPSDSGRWWVKNRSLCQKWKNWLDARRKCFSLKMAGKTIYWRSDDGRSGRARVASTQSVPENLHIQTAQLQPAVQ